MNRDEKIELIKKLLNSYVNLPYNSWLKSEEADDLFKMISASADEKVDKYLNLLAETLEKIWQKINQTNLWVEKMINKDNENSEKENEENYINNLFNNL